MSTVLRSQLECKRCGQLIASLHRHDFRTCKCGAVSLDGGRDYMRIVGNREDWEPRSLVIDADVTQDDARRLIECLNAVRAADGCSEDDPHSPYQRYKNVPWVPASQVRWMIASSERHRRWNVHARARTDFSGCWPSYDVTEYLQRLADEGLLEVRLSKGGKRTGWRCTKPVVAYGWWHGTFERRA